MACTMNVHLWCLYQAQLYDGRYHERASLVSILELLVSARTDGTKVGTMNVLFGVNTGASGVSARNTCTVACNMDMHLWYLYQIF